MPRIRQFLLLPAAGIGVAAAILSAPIAAADDEPGANQPLLPQCENVEGSAVTGGQTTQCDTPGNAELNATPQEFPGEEEFWGFPAFGFW